MMPADKLSDKLSKALNRQGETVASLQAAQAESGDTIDKVITIAGDTEEITFGSETVTLTKQTAGTFKIGAAKVGRSDVG